MKTKQGLVIEPTDKHYSEWWCTKSQPWPHVGTVSHMFTRVILAQMQGLLPMGKRVHGEKEK